MVRAINRLVVFITRHWLALANLGLAVAPAFALLAPLLMLWGREGAGQLLYLAYRPLCHQLPERSFFLGGPRAVYSLAQMSAHLGYEAPARWIGDAQLGYKMAFCERDAAIYGGWVLAGLIFALVREWRGRFANRPYNGPIKALPWQGLVLTMAPMAVDGTGQLFGVWESTWWLRVITGALFALGTVWFAYPHAEEGMKEAQSIALASLEDRDAADG